MGLGAAHFLAAFIAVVSRLCSCKLLVAWLQLVSCKLTLYRSCCDNGINRNSTYAHDRYDTPGELHENHKSFRSSRASGACPCGSKVVCPLTDAFSGALQIVSDDDHDIDLHGTALHS